MEIHETIKDLLKNVPSPLIVEIGSHKFEDTEQLYNNIPNAEIHCFECDPRNVEFAKHHRLTIDNKVIFHPYAISNVNGEKELHLSTSQDNWSGSSSLNKPKEHLNMFPHIQFNEIVKVQCTTLDNFFETRLNSRNIDFCWSDAQGEELNIIRGAQLALSRTKYFWFEYYQSQVYENQPMLFDITSALPGRWRIVLKQAHEVLVENLTFEITQKNTQA
jgi:FkbM family methyltransferase